MSNPATFSLCVYCGSRSGTNPKFTESAAAVGRYIGIHGGQLVYGGGRTGLMGVVADATVEAGGRVIGVIPEALVEREFANVRCDELHVVKTMHERKAIMAEKSNAFLALPGGVGTFEELFEIWTWRNLGYHVMPVGLLNSEGYYDGLLHFLLGSVECGFTTQEQLDKLHVHADIQTLLDNLRESSPRHSSAELLVNNV